MTTEKEKPATANAMLELYRKMMSQDDLDNLKAVADNYVHMLAHQRQCFPDIKYHRTFIRTFFFVVHWRFQGHDSTVKAIADFHELSWNSMERRLQHWEDHGLCTLVKRNGNTYVYGTEVGMEGALNYTKSLGNFFKPVSQCRASK